MTKKKKKNPRQEWASLPFDEMLRGHFKFALPPPLVVATGPK
jgi:hypothetical protein